MTSPCRARLAYKSGLIGSLIWILFGGCAACAADNIDLIVPLDPPCGHYTIDGGVRFAGNTAVVSGEEEILLTNTTGRPLTRLVFDWQLDDQSTFEMTAAGRPVSDFAPSGTTDASPIIVVLPEPVAAGQDLELHIRFETTFASETDETKHLWTSWFPRLDWGVRAQDDFIVKFDHPAEFTFASSGRYDPGTDTWRAEGVRRFGVFLMKGAQVTEGRAGDVALRILHTDAGADCARLIMATAVDVVDFYTERFGLFPTDHMTILPGADQPMGGYPPATSLVVIHGMERMAERDDLHWRWITAHEFGHQYWYEHTMSETRRHFGWLMIGLGIYVDREYMRARGYRSDKHTELIARYTDGVREGLDTRADVYDDYLETIDFDFNNVVVHGKGYAIISALDCLLGDELFDRIHGRCLHEFAGRRMTCADFQAVCEEESHQDLDWFFDQWVRSTRYLSYAIVGQTCEPDGDGYRTEITVERIGTLDMPVPVTARFANGTEQTVFTGRRCATNVVCFTSDAELSEAVIDAKGELAMVVPAPDPEEIELCRRLRDLPSSADIAALPELTAEALARDIERTRFWGVLGRKLYDWGFYEDALAVFDRRVDLLDQAGSVWVMSGQGWRGLLLDLLGRRHEAIEAYQRALAIEADRDFAYGGDPVTINRAWLLERLETPFVRPGA